MFSFMAVTCYLQTNEVRTTNFEVYILTSNSYSSNAKVRILHSEETKAYTRAYLFPTFT
jgi:hypothetical protein